VFAADVVHGVLLVLVLAALWLLPSWLVAAYARRKGYSFALFLLLGLIVSWVLALLVALVLRDRRTPTGDVPGA
jgi:hypothetical protein